jgi:hypothetical protein
MPILLKRFQHLSCTILSCHLRMRINRVPRHDKNGEVPSSGSLSIFSNLGRPILKIVVRGRYLSEIEFKQSHNYVIYYYDELRPFI